MRFLPCRVRSQRIGVGGQASEALTHKNPKKRRFKENQITEWGEERDSRYTVTLPGSFLTNCSAAYLQSSALEPKSRSRWLRFMKVERIVRWAEQARLPQRYWALSVAFSKYREYPTYESLWEITNWRSALKAAEHVQENGEKEKKKPCDHSQVNAWMMLQQDCGMFWKASRIGLIGNILVRAQEPISAAFWCISSKSLHKYGLG